MGLPIYFSNCMVKPEAFVCAPIPCMLLYWPEQGEGKYNDVEKEETVDEMQLLI